ncbi:MAG: hypothetical protein WCP01_13765 [Methylococcaceae bacterium]
MKTKHYDVFIEAVGVIRKKASFSDDYVNKLLFANVVTVFETYLHGIALSLMEADGKIIQQVAGSKKFKTQTIYLHKALSWDLGKYVISLVNKIVFHNLSEVEPLFREAFDVQIIIKDEILKIIEVRHDVIHRNGYTKKGESCGINKDRVMAAADEFEHLVTDIDNKFIVKYAQVLM